jgi:hypothetical protein
MPSEQNQLVTLSKPLIGEHTTCSEGVGEHTAHSKGGNLDLTKMERKSWNMKIQVRSKKNPIHYNTKNFCKTLKLKKPTGVCSWKEGRMKHC